MHETKLKSKSDQEPKERDRLRLVGFKPFKSVLKNPSLGTEVVYTNGSRARSEAMASRIDKNNFECR